MRHLFTLCILLLLSSGNLIAQPAGQSKPAKGAAKATITFQLDPASELKNVKHPATIGIRGSVPPLAWDKTYQLTDKNHDGIYESTVIFSPLTPGQTLEYKYVHDSVVWETTANRVLPRQTGVTILPVQPWNSGPPDPRKVDAAALYQEIAAADKALFAAYNNRDLEKVISYFSEDLEFYHDLGGLTNYAENRRQFQETLAKPNAPRRELVPGSLEVYPVPGYGAMEVGAHEFCHDENGQRDCGTFKFVMIWQKKDGAWKITRVASYGH